LVVGLHAKEIPNETLDVDIDVETQGESDIETEKGKKKDEERQRQKQIKKRKQNESWNRKIKDRSIFQGGHSKYEQRCRHLLVLSPAHGDRR